MSAVATRRRLIFVACLFAAGSIAAGPDDGGSSGDGASDDAGQTDGTTAADATSSADATMSSDGGAMAMDAGTMSTMEAASDDSSAAAESASYVSIGCPAPAAHSPAPYTVGTVLDDGGNIPSGDADIMALLCIDKPDAPQFLFDTVQAPYTTAADCKTFDPSDGHQNARNCLCDKCFTLMQECDSLPGCQEIRKCAWDNSGSCSSALTCYFTACTNQIDKWGNTSLQAFLAGQLAPCAMSNGCPSQ